MTLTEEELREASRVLEILKPMSVEHALYILAFVLRTISTVSGGELKGVLENYMEAFVAECGNRSWQLH